MADLKIAGLVNRMSLIVADEALVILEHSSTKDRVIKILYENIESIIVWKKTSWVSMILAMVILGGAAYIPLSAYRTLKDESMLWIAIFLGVLLVALELVMVIRKKYYLRINHGGEAFNVAAPIFPWQIRKFIGSVKEKTEAAQKELREKRDQAAHVHHEPAESEPASAHLPPASA